MTCLINLEWGTLMSRGELNEKSISELTNLDEFFDNHSKKFSSFEDESKFYLSIFYFCRDFLPLNEKNKINTCNTNGLLNQYYKEFIINKRKHDITYEGKDLTNILVDRQYIREQLYPEFKLITHNLDLPLDYKKSILFPISEFSLI